MLGNGKSRQTWLKRSLATKDAGDANRRGKTVQLDFDRILDSAKGLLAARPLRDNLSDAEINLIADHHYWWMLHSDDEETREGTGRDEAMRAIAKQFDEAGVKYTMPIPPSEHTPPFGLSRSDVFRKINDLEFVMPIMKGALATGDVSKVDEFLDYELHLFGINLDQQSEAYRRLGMAVLRKQVAALEAIRQRIQGQPIETPRMSFVPGEAAANASSETARGIRGVEAAERTCTRNACRIRTRNQVVRLRTAWRHPGWSNSEEPCPKIPRSLAGRAASPDW